MLLASSTIKTDIFQSYTNTASSAHHRIHKWDAYAFYRYRWYTLPKLYYDLTRVSTEYVFYRLTDGERTGCRSWGL